MFNRLGLIGCGLMGGSLSLALQRAQLVKQVVGYSTSQHTLEVAYRNGVIHAAAPSAAETRWSVSAAASREREANAPGAPAFDLELLRWRAGPAGASFSRLPPAS